MSKKIQILIILLLLFLGTLLFLDNQKCQQLKTATDESVYDDWEVSFCLFHYNYPSPVEDTKYQIWAFADPQYDADRPGRRDNLKKTLANTQAGKFIWDHAIVAGDIAEHAYPSEFESYMQDIKETQRLDDFYHIAGNHDGICNEEQDCFNAYKENINQQLFYSFDKGNIHFIMVSPNKKSDPNQISPSTLAWMQEEIKKNQDKIIVVVTHQPYNYYMGAVDIIDTGQVDLWLYGHTHCALNKESICLDGTGREKEEFPVNCRKIYKTTFLDLGTVMNNDSRLLIFTNNSDILHIQTIDHDSGPKNFTRAIRLSQPFQLDSYATN